MFSPTPKNTGYWAKETKMIYTETELPPHTCKVSLSALSEPQNYKTTNKSKTLNRETVIFFKRQSQWTKLPLDIRRISVNSRVSNNPLWKTEQNRHFLKETKKGKPRRRGNKLAWPHLPRKGKSGAGRYHVSAAGRLRIRLSRFLHSSDIYTSFPTYLSRLSNSKAISNIVKPFLKYSTRAKCI